jgi:methionyl-tRNA formyltransferase
VLRAAFAGTPEFALPALAALIEHHEVVGVLTQPDRPRGRGQHVAPSAVKEAAQARRLPLAQPPSLKTPAGRAELAAWAPDVLVVVAYGLMLPDEVLALPPLGCINLHASLLPRWRGAAPIQRAILAGDPQSGVTIMRMDAGLDTGPLLLQRSLALEAGETAGSLGGKLARLGAAALLEALTGLASGSLCPRPQPAEGVTHAAKIVKAEARIDWRGEALALERQVRAFNPRPVAETALAGEPLRIYGAHAHAAKDHETDPKSVDPGTIIAVRDDGIQVQCGRGQLRVTEVQRPGRRPVAAREYAHGLSLVGRRFG